MSDVNKINKGVGKVILKKVQELANLRGRLEQREYIQKMIKVTAPKTTGASYASVAKAVLPKVGKNTVMPRDVEKTVLIYSKDETVTDSEATNKVDC